MSIMKDSNVDDAWLREVMTKNPPRMMASGELFTGPVRLSFPNFHEAIPEGKLDAGKFVATLLFPPGTDMGVFTKAWTDAARAKFPKNFDDQGRPVELESPFHDQREKAFGDKPRQGYTPGGIYFKVSTRYKPTVVDLQKRPLLDPAKVYPGVWAFAVLNTYSYGPPQPKKGVSFGLQSVMIAYDDQRLGGSGSRDAASDFGAVTLTATSNVAAKFDGLPGAQQPASASVMPAGGHVGQAGGLATHALPGQETEEQRLLREMGA